MKKTLKRKNSSVSLEINNIMICGSYSNTLPQNPMGEYEKELYYISLEKLCRENRRYGV
jgi:hypothetical protein